MEFFLRANGHVSRTEKDASTDSQPSAHGTLRRVGEPLR